MQRVDLINAIIDELLRGLVELPAYSTLLIAEDVASEGETDFIDLINSRLMRCNANSLITSSTLTWIGTVAPLTASSASLNAPHETIWIHSSSNVGGSTN